MSWFASVKWLAAIGMFILSAALTYEIVLDLEKLWTRGPLLVALVVCLNLIGWCCGVYMLMMALGKVKP